VREGRRQVLATLLLPLDADVLDHGRGHTFTGRGLSTVPSGGGRWGAGGTRAGCRAGARTGRL